MVNCGLVFMQHFLALRWCDLAETQTDAPNAGSRDNCQLLQVSGGFSGRSTWCKRTGLSPVRHALQVFPLTVNSTVEKKTRSNFTEFAITRCTAQMWLILFLDTKRRKTALLKPRHMKQSVRSETQEGCWVTGFLRKTYGHCIPSTSVLWPV